MRRATLALAFTLVAIAIVGGAYGSAPLPATPPAGDFVPTIDNPYYPQKPGTKRVYTGETDDGETIRVEVNVTHKTKRVLGITATVVEDYVTIDGEPEERTFDWYAQDRYGNVWYLGEDSRDYVDGEWVRSPGSWEAGIDGARPGIIMLANPKVGDEYKQELYVGHAEDEARVLALDERVRVPYGRRFKNVLKTLESTPLEPDVAEHKFYAKGVGEIRTRHLDSAEFTELVSMEPSAASTGSGQAEPGPRDDHRGARAGRPTDARARHPRRS
jgi:hypothetical protein